MFKSSWGGWLALASVIVFPAMLYLTRPAPTEAIQKSENLSQKQAEVSAEQADDKNQQLSSTRIGHSENDIDRLEESDIDPDLNNISDRSEDESNVSAWDKHYPTAHEQFSQAQPYTPRQNYNRDSGSGVSGNRIVRTGFAARINVQAEAATATAKSPSRTGQKQATPDNINASLYLAEIQAPVQSNKSKCPPVYMALNDYAKNMRTAMGCDSE